ncbi:S8 family serine peptidase [Jiangella alkaliphila]|uniref:alpha-amylase n=1 Tax=Jiangella alkaliphila TaxID=419479 RepID=A0A1H2LCL3_9ACTN|nr:S8 family serine peptidase [Jiangella alkaliphila]SDU78554.1 Serine protease, subtilisin family [Jiangella alkaliphila]
MRSRPRRARRSTRVRAGAGLLGALVVLAPGLVPAATASGQAPTLRAAVVDPALRAEVADAAPGEELDYLLSLRAAPDLAVIENDHDAVVAALKEVAATSQPAVIDEIEDRGAEVLNTFWIGNLILIRSTADVLAALSNEPAVARVLAVQEMTVPEPEPDQAPADAEDVTWGLGHIGADDVWDEFGVTGSGVRVAVLDTGVNARHPDLSTRLATDVPGDPYFPGGWMEWDTNGVPRHTLPADTNGHGTHVSGTVLGGDASGTHIGVAPGARLMSGRVLPSGSGTTPQIIAGMQWAVDPYDHAGNPAGEPARVVNMSFSPSTGGVIDAMVQPLRNMVAAGVLPVAAAGNCGEGCHGGPGDIPEALTVGATDVADDVAAFSSGATVTTAEFQQPPADWPQSWVVPDVSAPGVDVYSSSSNAFGGIVYARNNGTSMAAPHVAGVAALMLSADPTLTVGQITDALRDTSSFDDRYGLARPNTRYGQGRVDARRAVAHVALHTGVAGTVVDAASLAPVPDVVVSVPGLGVSQRTTTDGRFDLRLPPGTYSLEAAWEGRLVATVDALTVTDTVRSADIALSGVAGRVIDAVTGKPASHTAVTAQGTAGDTGVSTTTAGDGSYRLYLSPGTYTLTARRFGYADLAGAGASVTDGQVTSRDLALSPLPTSTITGVVSYAASGTGVPGVTVELADGPRSAVTDSDGRYTIKDVPRGTHRVVAKPELFVEPAPVDVTTTAGSASTVDFTLACGGECPGLWVAREHGPVAAGQDSASATVVSPDGRRLYVAGTSSGEGSQVDYLTVAYDTATGRTLWQARYDGPARGQDGVNDIALSPDGARVYVTGLSVGQGVGPSGGDYATLAYDASTGDELWLARYNGPGDNFDNARAVEVSPDGGTVLVTGQVQLRTGTTSHTDYGTVAYDAVSGFQRWVALYDGPAVGFDSANDLAVSPRGDAVFVTGHSPGAGSGWDHATVAYAVRTGEQLWAARYDGPAGGSDDAGALAVSPDGDRLFVTGTTAGDRGLPDYATVAYDTSDGARLWTAAYDGPGGSLDRATALAVSPDGSGVYVTGQSSAGSTGATADYATVRYAAATGATSWVARYSGDAEGADAAAAVAVSRDGSQVVVTGTSAGDGSGDDFATVAYEPADGTQRWAARYDGPAGDDDDAAAVTVSPDGERVFVTGGSDLGIGDDPLVAPSDFATLAYDAAGNARTPVFVSHDVRAVPPVVAAGDPLHTVAEVTNVGVGTGSYAATLVLDGVVAVTTDVALGPGESTTVGWDLPEIAAGTHELRVGAASSELLAVACDRTLTGQHRGLLTVSSGTTCLGDGARVTGGVTVEAGAGLLATRASITGPVTAAGPAVLALTDASVSGPVTATGVTQALSIVSSRTGPLTVDDNAPLLPAAVSGNDVHGPLTCTDNTPAPIDLGDPNEAGGRGGGQCSAR